MRRAISFQGLTAFLLMIFFAQAVHATWSSNGVPVGPYPIPQPENLQSVSDGAGGAIITWKGHRDFGEFVYAQRIDAEGNNRWTPGGVALCPGTGDQFYPQIVADGIGGAIIAWDDRRDGSWKIYAQRVDASGAVQWITGGVPICTAWVIMATFHVTSDGAGGAIVTWRDGRNASNDIYAQRVDPSGAVQWTPDGIPVCLEPSYKNNVQATTDGTGGAIIAWEDGRDDSMNIYAQRIGALGAVQWAPSGVIICQSSVHQRNPCISTDGDGGAIIAWEDYRNGFDLDIYTQRISASGLAQWAEDGVPLCTETGNQQNFQIISDGAGGVIGAWEDMRNGVTSSEVFTQRLDSSGTAQWTTGGVQVCTTSDSQYDPRLTSDGAGGAIVTWEYMHNLPNGSDIFGQRIDGSGTVQWTADGVALVSVPEDQNLPKITSDGTGGAIVAWLDQRDGSDEIYAQQLDSFGVQQWAANGEPICVATGVQVSARIASDGTGGSIISWLDGRGGSMSIYAQRVDASGTTLWPSDGVPLLSSTWDVSLAEIASDGAGGAIFCWADLRNGISNIYVQQVDASGTVQWATDGIPLHVQLSPQNWQQIVSDGAGGAVVTWQDARNGFTDIYVQRVDASGAMSWISGGVPACIAPGSSELPQITTDGSGGVIVSWEDMRNGPQKDIYAQRINAVGTILWATDGVPICTAPEWQQYSQIASDGASGAIITWIDKRNVVSDIYAQRIGAAGAVLWSTDGVPLCAAAEGQGGARITSDLVGGAIIAWFDWRNDSFGIYAQRVSALGTVQWTIDGVPICTTTGQYDYPGIITDGASGAILTWQDYRGDETDVYAQRLSASGTAMWATDGIPVCATTGLRVFPRITSDDTGGAIVTWGDYRSGIGQIYAQRMTGDGPGPICAIDPEVIEIPEIMEVGAYCDTTFTISNVGMGELIGYVEEACDNFEVVSGGGSFVLGSGQAHLVTVRFEPTVPGAHQCTIETGINLCSTVTISGTASGGELEVPAGLPTRYALYSCVPNPFNPQTMIRYDLPQAAQVSLHIYDIAGRLVRTLASGEFVEPGHHESVWRGRDDNGRQVAAGVYFYRLVAGQFEQTRRMALIK